MALLRCPRCDAALPLLPRWREWRRSVRHCPSCGAWLRPAHLELLIVIFSFASGLGIVATRDLGWWRLLLAPAVALLFMAGLYRLVRWRVVPEPREDPPPVRRWVRVMNACLTVQVALLLATWPVAWLHGRQLPGAAHAPANAQPVTTSLIIWTSACVGGSLVAAMGMAVAARMQCRARRAAMAGLEQGPEAQP